MASFLIRLSAIVLGGLLVNYLWWNYFKVDQHQPPKPPEKRIEEPIPNRTVIKPEPQQVPKPQKPLVEKSYPKASVLTPDTRQPIGGSVQDVNLGRGGEVININELPVKGKITLVDFFSPFCPPCMRLAPLLEQLAQKRSDLAIKKVNIQRPEVSGKIDWQSPLTKQLELRAIPHFKIFDKQGKLTAEDQEAMRQVLDWLYKDGLIRK